jgi:hypothetical protein
MSDPKRLLETGDEFERELLGSALPDRGSDRALQRTLVSIGAGTAITVAAAPTFGASVVLKWLGIGAVAGLVTAGSVDFVTHRSGSESTVRAVAATPAAARPVATAPGNPPPGLPAEPAFEPTPPSAARAPAPPMPHDGTEVPALVAPSVGALPPQMPSAERLLLEVRALDRAKAALSRGDSGAALAALDDHARSFPRAALAPEAGVLRVRALLAGGNRGAALAIARRVVSAQPDSAHARAMKSLFPELERSGASNP